MKPLFYLLLVLLPLFAFIALRVEEDSGKGVKTPCDEWTRIERRSINRINYRHPEDSREIKFAKDSQGYWFVVQPLRDLAAQAKVQSFISIVFDAEIDRVFNRNEAHRNLARELAVELEFFEATKSLSVKLYRLPSHPASVFMNFSTEPDLLYKAVHKTPPEFKPSVDDYRSRAVFPFPLAAVQSFEYIRGNQVYRFKQDAQSGRWIAEQEVGKAFEAVFRRFQNAEASGYAGKEEIQGEAEAVYVFDFGEARAVLKLHRLRGGRFAAFFEGHPQGKIISLQTLLEYFPRVDESR